MHALKLERMQAARSASEQRVPDPLLLRQGVLPALTALLRGGHVAMLQAWPVRRGGGRAGACALLCAVADLLLAPLLPRARFSPEHIQRLHEVWRLIMLLRMEEQWPKKRQARKDVLRNNHWLYSTDELTPA